MTETATVHKCERWIDSQVGNKCRCGQPAVQLFVPENAPGYAWWACTEHLEDIQAR